MSVYFGYTIVISTFKSKPKRDEMRILYLSLAGRWWRAECKTGEYYGKHMTCDIIDITRNVIIWAKCGHSSVDDIYSS